MGSIPAPEIVEVEVSDDVSSFTGEKVVVVEAKYFSKSVCPDVEDIVPESSAFEVT